eukprot:11414291-Heterocapsa_arctica.AAC.1
MENIRAGTPNTSSNSAKMSHDTHWPPSEICYLPGARFQYVFSLPTACHNSPPSGFHIWVA